MSGNHRLTRGALLVAFAFAPAAACSSTSDTASGSSTTAGASTSSPGGGSTGSTGGTATGATKALRILVTDDDGIGADGIDALVEGLRALPDTEVVVSAPATNQSGTSDKTSIIPPEGVSATTKSGFEGFAVPGFPADAVRWALDGGVEERPHVVIAGINVGQNLGPLTELSGTVGAARAAARRGIPALAVSQGLGDPMDYPITVELVLDWVAEHRAELLARSESDTSPAEVDNLNGPSCGTTGDFKGVIDVPVAADYSSGNPLDLSDCGTDVTDPVDDIAAFLNGFAPFTESISLGTPSAPVEYVPTTEAA